MVARRQGDPGPRAAADDREGESRGSAAEGGGGRGRDGAAGCVVGCWILFSRLEEKHAPADGWAPGANALGCECPPASADGRRLLLDFAPKGIRTRVPTCSATHKRGAWEPVSRSDAGIVRRSLFSPSPSRGRPGWGWVSVPLAVLPVTKSEKGSPQPEEPRE